MKKGRGFFPAKPILIKPKFNANKCKHQLDTTKIKIIVQTINEVIFFLRIEAIFSRMWDRSTSKYFDYKSKK